MPIMGAKCTWYPGRAQDTSCFPKLKVNVSTWHQHRILRQTIASWRGDADVVQTVAASLKTGALRRTLERATNATERRKKVKR